MKKTILACAVLCVCTSEVMAMRRSSITFPLVSQLRETPVTPLQRLAQVTEQLDSVSQTSQSTAVATQVPSVVLSIELTLNKRMQEAFHYLIYAQHYGAGLFVRGNANYKKVADLIGGASKQVRKAFVCFLSQAGRNVEVKPPREEREQHAAIPVDTTNPASVTKKVGESPSVKKNKHKKTEV